MAIPSGFSRIARVVSESTEEFFAARETNALPATPCHRMQFASPMSAKKIVRPVQPGTSEAWVTPSLEESADYQLLLLRAFELPPICREVVVLRDVHGHAVPEIAARLGISHAAVERRLRRAEKWLTARTDSQRTS